MITQMTEFNLSEKVVYAVHRSDKDCLGWGDSAIKSEDVKEFIRLLKEKYQKAWDNHMMYPDDLFELIDALAGEKLIK